MREIVSHELYKRGVDSSAWSWGRTARGRIVAPALRSLTMAGPRDMECGLLSDFLTAMFPNLEALVADGWIGFHADEFLGFLRSAAPNNNEVKRMKLNFRKDEPDRLGLLLLLPKVLSVAYDLEVDTKTPVGPLDYTPHIRHLSLGHWTTTAYYKGNWPTKTPTPRTLEYIQEDAFHQTCHLDRLWPEYAQKIDADSDKAALLHQHFRVALLREANWALACPILEQLRSLTIPVTDIKRYLDDVDRLKDLEHVQFCLDEVFEYRTENVGNDPATAELMEATKLRKDEAMQDLVRFVKEHARLFRGRLKTAVCPDSNMWPYAEQFCPEEIQLQFLQALLALHKPNFLNNTHWMQFVAHLSSTGLGYVQEIDLQNIGSTLYNRDFLQRCRALRRLKLDSLGQGSFNWAVQEKMGMQRTDNSVNNTFVTHNNKQDTMLLHNDHRPLFLQYGLVPLETVDINLSMTPFADDVDDIAFAFSATLTKLSARRSYTPFSIPWGTQSLPQSIHVGRGWVDLPCLTELCLLFERIRLVIDQYLLIHCPNVVTVLLGDRTFEHHLQGLVPCRSAHLPRLKSLDIYGWSALTFHPETLRSASNLTDLSLQMIMTNENECYIASPRHESNDDGNSPLPEIERPCWTWDWYLPQLAMLDLNSEFAYNFQLQMLSGCPALEDLALNIYTLQGHYREISRADLYGPNAADSVDNVDSIDSVDSEEMDSGPGERIVAHSLQRLRMEGHWRFGSGELLSDFLTGMFPSLLYLTAVKWEGVRITDVINHLRNVPEDNQIYIIEMDDEFLDDGVLTSAAECNLSLVRELEGLEETDVLSARLEIGYWYFHILKKAPSS
ncbi:hypothetical protein BGX33_010740 [Mortierella sp. NVP41]|nr:hypothetical protein BGX33_010740 [Mortierella sp. NVP41]